MSARPRLRTTRRLVERSPGALQLGTDERAIVIDGLPPALAGCVRRLDGSHSIFELEDRCTAAGVPVAALHDLLGALDEIGALERDDDRDRPRHRRLAVNHPEALDTLVDRGVDPAEARRLIARPARTRVAVLGRGTLARAVADALDGLVADVETAPPGSPTSAETVVLVARDAVDPTHAGLLVLAGKTVLPVVSTGTGIVVGPWHGGADDPCATCLDLRRAAGDEAWPQMLAQLTAPDHDGMAPHAGADPVAARVAASVVAQWLRRRVVGLPESPGLTCEVDPWDLGMLHRVWPVHPGCPHHDAAIGSASGPRQATLAV